MLCSDWSSLIPAYILIGQKLENKAPLVRVATTIGIMGLIVQMIGLLRWTFVVPVLANSFVQSTDMATKQAVVVAFKTIHQLAGVLLGEHLGQLFTIIWTVIMSISFYKLKLLPKWVESLGFISSFIYLLARVDLFATVIPRFPVVKLAGFIGSTLWWLWLIIVGVKFFKVRIEECDSLPIFVCQDVKIGFNLRFFSRASTGKANLAGFKGRFLAKTCGAGLSS